MEDRDEKQEEEEEPQNQKEMEKEGVIGANSDVTNRPTGGLSLVWKQRMSHQGLGFLSSGQL